MARKILDNPPPLTPASQRNFPYVVRSFPTRYLLDHTNLKTSPAKKERDAAENVVE